MTSFYENLMRRQYEGNGERQMFCRFHDGNSLFIRTSHGRASKQTGSNTLSHPQDEREELESTCLALGGFCQPQPYVNLHQTLGLSDDGFLDRISTCIVDSNILKESDVELWNETLDSYNIAEFNVPTETATTTSILTTDMLNNWITTITVTTTTTKCAVNTAALKQQRQLRADTCVYRSIYQIHSKPRSYTFAPEARVLYQEFSDEIVQEMNRQLQEDVIVEDNMSKDRKIFVRLCAVVHVLFTVLNYFLKEGIQQVECSFIPLENDVETARTVEQIVKYFASQRRVINKVKKTQPKIVHTATINECSDKTESDEPVVDDIFNELGTLIIAACAGKTSQQISLFVRKTMYGHNDAIAVRWQEIPQKRAGEENEAVKKKHQEELKNEWFAKMSKHPGNCIKSTTREMWQKDGIWKGVRCSVIQCSAFDGEMLTSLKQVIPDIESELPTGSHLHLSKIQDESTILDDTLKVPSPNARSNVVPVNVTDLSVVKETVPENVRDVPMVVPEIPKIVPEAPKIVSKVPKIVPSVPEIVPETPKVVPEVPKIASEVPKIVPRVTKIVPEVPKIVPAVPVIVPDIPKIVADVSKIVPEVPVVLPDIPVTVPDVPDTTLDVKSDAPATVKARGKKRAISGLEDALSKNEKVVGKRVRYR